MESTVIVEREGSQSATLTFAQATTPFDGISGSFNNAYRDMLVTTTGTIGVNEAYSKNAEYSRTFISGLRLTEKTKYATHKNLQSYLSVTGEHYRSPRKPFGEKFTFADGYDKKVKFSRTFASTLKATEIIRKKAKSLFPCGINITDAQNKETFAELDNAFSEYSDMQFITDITFKIKKVDPVKLSMADQYARDVVFSRNFARTISFDEQPQKRIYRPLNDAFGITDIVNDSTFDEATMTFAENENRFITDILFKVKKVSPINIGISENLAKGLKYHLQDEINLGETLTHKAIFNRAYDEHISSSELFKAAYAYKSNENLLVYEDNAKSVNAPFAEAYKIGDGFDKTAWYRRTLSEGTLLTDVLSNRPAKALADYIGIYDSYIKPSGGILSNLYVCEGGMSLSDFLTSATKISGYTAFKEFKVGEYEYKDALVRIVMKASDQAKPTAQEVTMHVDIPDTDDRGTAQITDTTGATQIPFNKDYYTVPEVQVTLKNATVSQGVIIPSITNITTEYFEVELIKGTTLTTGIITWVAKGY